MKKQEKTAGEVIFQKADDRHKDHIEKVREALIAYAKCLDDDSVVPIFRIVKELVELGSR